MLIDRSILRGFQYGVDSHSSYGINICLIFGWTIILAGGMGNSKSYDQNSYNWMGTPVVSGQTNAIVPDYLEACGAQRPDWDPYGPGAVPELGRPEWDPYGAGSVSLALSLVPANPAPEGLAVEEASSSPISSICKQVLSSWAVQRNIWECHMCSGQG